MEMWQSMKALLLEVDENGFKKKKKVSRSCHNKEKLKKDNPNVHYRQDMLCFYEMDGEFQRHQTFWLAETSPSGLPQIPPHPVRKEPPKSILYVRRSSAKQESVFRLLSGPGDPTEFRCSDWQATRESCRRPSTSALWPCEGLSQPAVWKSLHSYKSRLKSLTPPTDGKVSEGVKNQSGDRPKWPWHLLTTAMWPSD